MTEEEMRTQTRSLTVESVEDHSPHWLVYLADNSTVAIPRLFDEPPTGTQLLITTVPYRLDPATDPHQDVRHRTVRVQWGDVVIHCAEFDELLLERDRLREMVLAMREQREQPRTVENALGAVGQRLRGALEALLAPAQSPQQTPGPFRNGVPPWAQPPGGPRGGNGGPEGFGSP